jgi:hypothetical protein
VAARGHSRVHGSSSRALRRPPQSGCDYRLLAVEVEGRVQVEVTIGNYFVERTDLGSLFPRGARPVVQEFLARAGKPTAQTPSLAGRLETAGRKDAARDARGNVRGIALSPRGLLSVLSVARRRLSESRFFRKFLEVEVQIEANRRAQCCVDSATRRLQAASGV